MTKLYSRAASITAFPDTTQARPEKPRTRRVRQFDFAALVRPRAATTNGAYDDGSRDEPPQAFSPTQSAEKKARPGARKEDEAVFQQIVVASLPVIDAVSLRQQRMIKLASVLANETATFASHRSIRQSGTWELTLIMDSRVLADTVLHISLSPTVLSLRFDVKDHATRVLLCTHSRLLESTMRTLLSSWGEPRDLECIFP
jgi:type III secretion control protein HpaP